MRAYVFFLDDGMRGHGVRQREKELSLWLAMLFCGCSEINNSDSMSPAYNIVGWARHVQN